MIGLLSVCLRVAIALFTRGFFQPDEYFQALEPAHRLVFGYGHLTWEWLGPRPVRGVLYPAINIPVYWILKASGLDRKYPAIVVASPRLIHGLLAALTDIWICKLAREVLDEAYVRPAYFLSLTSFFHAMSLSRSLSNSLETSLTTVALSHFPWDVKAPFSLARLRKCIFFAALACVIRPTNGIIWIYMFSALALQGRSHAKSLIIFARDAAIIGFVAIVLSLSCVLDTLFYGRPVLTLLNFLLVNASPLSSFYGSSPWHYYLSQAIPILCTTSLPFVLHGSFLAVKKNEAKLKILTGCVVWTVGVYSLLGHKEWRFLHPLLPMLHVLGARSLRELYNHSAQEHRSRQPSRRTKRLAGLPLRTRDLMLLLLPVPASIYVALFHCTGQIEVMSYLRRLPVDDSATIGFLVPCHSTPWQAYLHRPDLAHPGKMWALGCEPPLMVRDKAGYRDQTDLFFESPITYILSHFPSQVDPSFPPSPFPSSMPDVSFVGTLGEIESRSRSWDMGWRHEWPRYIVMFGALLQEPGILSLLQEKGYREIWKGGGEWDGDARRKGGVRVWKHGTL
ncbi:glycosyltransferase family 22 protein [Pisolithus marmoratus]|nr:glycosyltransferase family 22 protein [Pisolithus marmoratus]